jgi:hypothetical protein
MGIQYILRSLPRANSAADRPDYSILHPARQQLGSFSTISWLRNQHCTGNSTMIIYDDIFSWEGWGGQLRLASGECRLRIFDLQKNKAGGPAYLRPIIVLVSDVPESRMSVRSCTGHIATNVTRMFKIEPDRMLYIEYYPETAYGENNEHIIPEKYDVVDFTWHEGRAIEPKWRALKPPLLDVIKEIVEGRSSKG